MEKTKPTINSLNDYEASILHLMISQFRETGLGFMEFIILCKSSGVKEFVAIGDKLAKENFEFMVFDNGAFSRN